MVVVVTYQHGCGGPHYPHGQCQQCLQMCHNLHHLHQWLHFTHSLSVPRRVAAAGAVIHPEETSDDFRS